MKKNIGAKLALYPTPLVVVGTMGKREAQLDSGGASGHHRP